MHLAEILLVVGVEFTDIFNELMVMSFCFYSKWLDRGVRHELGPQNIHKLGSCFWSVYTIRGKFKNRISSVKCEPLTAVGNVFPKAFLFFFTRYQVAGVGDKKIACLDTFDITEITGNLRTDVFVLSKQFQ